MKIAIIAPHFPTMSYPCGAADFVHQYCLNLKKKGHEVTVLTNNPNPIKIDGIKIIAKVDAWSITRILELRKLAKIYQWDIIDVQYEAYMFGGSGTILLMPLLLKGINCKFVLTLHSQQLPKYFSSLFRLTQMVLFNEVVFYSSVLLDHMKKKFPKKAKHFHLLGFPSNLIRLNLSEYNDLINNFLNHKPRNQLACLYFGHISPGRDIEDLLNIINNLKLPIHLTLMSQFNPAENQYHRDLISLVSQNGLENKVTFTGRVDDKTITLMFKTHDLCLFPFPEGASLKNGSLAAAIEHEMPIITTKTALTDTVFLSNEKDSTDWFYTPQDTHQLEMILKKHFDNPELRQKNRQFWAQIRDHFSWENYIEKREHIFKGITNA